MTRPPHAASSVVGYASDTTSAVAKVEPNSNRSRETGRPSCSPVPLLRQPSEVEYGRPYGDIWVSQGATDPDGFLVAFKCRLHDVYSQQWCGRLHDSIRARFFREILPNCKFSELVDVITVQKHRIALTRLICSSHRLNSRDPAARCWQRGSSSFHRKNDG